MRRSFPIVHLLGATIGIFSLSMLVPVVVAWLDDDAAIFDYGASFVITLAAGALLYLPTLRAHRRDTRELQPRDGFLLVNLVWIVLPAFATLPLMMLIPRLSFTDAYFETMSGLTTTGATTLSGLDYFPPALLAWRGLLIWIGGMGILVLAVAILPLLGAGGSQVFRAETPGPMKDSRLTPRIAGTAKSLYGVYVGISLMCFLSLKVAGMTWLDAFCHMGSIMGLGGFSTHDDSIGFFNSVPIEIVTTFFMVVAAINFATHFRAFRHRSLAAYAQCPEARWTVGVMIVAALIVAAFLVEQGTYPNFWTALRYAMFNTVSLATTTGFSNTDYGTWPIFAPVFMLFLSSFASSAGSTGGGIKMIRAVLMFKQTSRELVRILHPRVVNPVRLGPDVVDNKVIFAMLAFMLVYGGAIIVLTIVLLATGLDVVSAFTAIIACINNTGPGLNQVGPSTTYASLTDFQTWICILAMLLGRLELFTLLVIFTPGFWRK